MDIKICKKFNLCIKDFLHDILVISSIDKLKSLSNKINKLYSINICSRLIITKFIENIVPLNEYIKNQNSAIFKILIEKEGKGDLFELMKELHLMWGNINENNKRKIFEYLLVLNYYCEEYIRNHIKKKGLHL